MGFSVKPIIPYYGGKQRIASKIVEVIHSIPHKVYVEPFAGGAAVLFAKGRPNVPADEYLEIINDINEDVVNLYRVCQTHKNELIHLLQHTPYSRTEFVRSRELLKDPTTEPLWRAWAVVVGTRQAFGNLSGDSSWGISKNGRNGALVFKNYLDVLPEILDRFQDVYIEHRDALGIIERFDNENTLYYCDPPYPGTDQGHYKGYTLDDYQRLVHTLDRIKGSYILSNYPQSIEPTSYEERIEIDAVMSVCAKKQDKEHHKRTEVLWVKRALDVGWQQERF